MWTTVALCAFLALTSCGASIQYPDLSSKATSKESSAKRLQITLVTSELTGLVRNGGIGTAYSNLAFALARAEHAVTVLFTRGRAAESGQFAEWQAIYAASNVDLVPLDVPTFSYLPRHLLISYAVLDYLEHQVADVVHFHEYGGAGYYSLLAKRQGLALEGAVAVVGLHGPTLWAKQHGNQGSVRDIADLELNYMEKTSVKLADVVVSPSAYMLDWISAQGWSFGPDAFVQPNLLGPGAFRSGNRTVQSVSELVFFGRLETRKGVAAFCDAVDLLRQPGSQLRAASAGLRRITFLGKAALVDGVPGDEYVRRRAVAWDVDVAVEASMTSEQAKEYLGQAGRLAVIPSREENSPYTVLECAAAGVPFLATDVGGIPDLIKPEDRQRALMPPSPPHMAHRIARALHEGVLPARPAVSGAENEATWVGWHEAIVAARRRLGASARRLSGLPPTRHVAHNYTVGGALGEAVGAGALGGGREGEGPDDWDAGAPPPPFVSVVITHYNRPALCQIALESVLTQSYPADRLEVILVDDGSTDVAARAWLDVAEAALAARNGTLVRSENIYLGAARNVGLRAAKGEFVLFMDDDNVAKPHEVATFVRAMAASGADVLTSFVDFFAAPGRPPPPRRHPSFLFLGGSAEVGAYKNCFGDANSFVRRDALLRLGGYTEDYGVGYEDWEMYAKAALQGYDVQIVPYSLYQYRFTPGSMQKTTDFVANRRRSLRAYLEHLPLDMHEPLTTAVLPRVRDGQPLPLQGLGAEGLSKFPGATSSDGEATRSWTLLEGAQPASARMGDEL